MYATVVEPMTRLTRQKEAFVWGQEQARAFESLKQSFAADPVLAHEKPIALKTDASGIGVAGILLQRSNEEWQMVTCCSRRVSDTEARYGITDLEGLAIVYSVTKLRNYLLGKHFTILTDHCALCSLKKKVPHSPRLYRWTLLLSEYDFSIQYIRGGLHQDVDCLSRAPVEENDDQLGDKLLAMVLRESEPHVDWRGLAQCLLVVPVDKASWREETAADVSGQEHLALARRRTKGYRILHGCLYYENRLFVPISRRQVIMKESHAEEAAGHGGVRDTADRMAQLL